MSEPVKIIAEPEFDLDEWVANKLQLAHQDYMAARNSNLRQFFDGYMAAIEDLKKELEA